MSGAEAIRSAIRSVVLIRDRRAAASISVGSIGNVLSSLGPRSGLLVRTLHKAAFISLSSPLDPLV